MPISSDPFYEYDTDEMIDVANMDLSGMEDDSLDDFLEPFKENEVTPDISPMSSILDSDDKENSSISSLVDQLTDNQFRMVAQPFQSSKLRYRADYNREKGRVGALSSKNGKSKRQGPAIYIPKCYLNSPDEYYIRVSLVTTKYHETNLHYFHPYELEDAKNETINDRENNSVWFPIGARDSIKHFPFLRVVKKRVLDTQKLDHLRVFDYYNDILKSTCEFHHNLRREVDVIKEYDLEKSQLAFTLGKIIINDGEASMCIYPKTTIFSDPMEEYTEKQSDIDIDTESSSDKNTSSSSNESVYKYAPRSSINGGNNEMLIFLKKRLQPHKYGDLQVIFEGETWRGHWSQSVNDININDRLLSFRIPIFPEPITKIMHVKMTLRQDHRVLDVLKYSYLPIPS